MTKEEIEMLIDERVELKITEKRCKPQPLKATHDKWLVSKDANGRSAFGKAFSDAKFFTINGRKICVESPEGRASRAWDHVRRLTCIIFGCSTTYEIKDEVAANVVAEELVRFVAQLARENERMEERRTDE